MQRRLRSQIPYVLMRLRKLQPELPVQNLQILSMKQHFVQYVTAEKFATQADFEESIEVVIAGYQKKNRVLSNKEKTDSCLS